MTDISDDYDQPWDDDYDDPMDDYPEPSEPDWEREEHYRRKALSPLGRFVYDLRDFTWGRTWQLRLRARSRWMRLTGRTAADPDEPPF